jgi:tetratricopeptide (TPR) repeat protein
MAQLTIVLLVALLIGSNGYFLWLRPQIHRGKLLTAVPLLDGETRRELERAEIQLVEALSAGLGRTDSRDARFALAWTRAKLGRFDAAKYGDALVTLAASESPDDSDPATDELRIWLLAQQGKHDEILRTLQRRPELAERPLIRPRYAAALEHRAVDLWTRRDVDAAVQTLEQARRLRVDSSVRLRDLVELLLEQGMRAIAERQMKVAEECFIRAEKMTPDTSVQRIEARLGQLIARWHREDPVSVLKSLGEEFDGLRRRGEQRGPGQDDVRQLRAHVGWWYLVTMLENWLDRLPARQGLPPDEREHFLAVVRTVTDADPELGDVVMMHGMLDLGLSSGPGIKAAVQTLERSTRTARGVVLPQVMDIIARWREAPTAPAGPDNWSTGPEPAPAPSAEPVEYPEPPAVIRVDELVEKAWEQMADPDVREALERLMRLLGGNGPGPEGGRS